MDRYYQALKTDMIEINGLVTTMIGGLNYSDEQILREQYLLLTKAQLALKQSGPRLGEARFNTLVGLCKQYVEKQDVPRPPNPQDDEVIEEERAPYRPMRMKRELKFHQRKMMAWFNGPAGRPMPTGYKSGPPKHPIRKRMGL